VPITRRRFRPFRLLWRLTLALFLLSVGLVATLRWIAPPFSSFMLQDALEGRTPKYAWVDYEDLPRSAPVAVIAAEDQTFLQHWGFDFEAIEDAMASSARGRRLRGASTISQQVAKNVFLWQGRMWVRKGLEAGFTVLIELLWPKRRIMEVYLNVAEMGEGIFGVQAAAQRYWGLDAAELGPQRAARLMATLPDPRNRSPISGTRFISERGASIERGAATIKTDGRAACFL
jgi:monofunctional glycosyltransferase